MNDKEIKEQKITRQDNSTDAEVTIDPEKTVYENISDYYDKLKKVRRKINRVKEEIEKTEKEIREEEKKENESKEMKKDGLEYIKRKEKIRKKWYHKFRWCFTHKGKLIVGGRNAGQNDELFLKHMDDYDLFFHADVPGGAVVILKNGILADETERKMAAAFAGVYSRAWKQGTASVDVYHVEKRQLSKHSMKGYIGRGAFAIEGKRKWYKNTKLEIYIIPYEKSPIKLISIPILEGLNNEIINYYRLSRLFRVKLIPGKKKPDEIAKEISKMTKKRISIKVNSSNIEYLIPGPSEIFFTQ